MENTSIQIRVAKDLKDQLEAKAKAEGRSLSNYIKRIIDNHTKQKEG